MAPQDPGWGGPSAARFLVACPPPGSAGVTQDVLLDECQVPKGVELSHE